MCSHFPTLSHLSLPRHTFPISDWLGPVCQKDPLTDPGNLVPVSSSSFSVIRIGGASPLHTLIAAWIPGLPQDISGKFSLPPEAHFIFGLRSVNQLYVYDVEIIPNGISM